VLGHAAGGHGDILRHVEEVPKVRDEHDARYRRLLAASHIDLPDPTEAASIYRRSYTGMGRSCRGSGTGAEWSC
jgi:hypothetical protein